ncbi:hypothetical protein ACRRTK_014260 [Alexandromys fortis]
MGWKKVGPPSQKGYGSRGAFYALCRADGASCTESALLYSGRDPSQSWRPCHLCPPTKQSQTQPQWAVRKVERPLPVPTAAAEHASHMQMSHVLTCKCHTC